MTEGILSKDVVPKFAFVNESLVARRNSIHRVACFPGIGGVAQVEHVVYIVFERSRPAKPMHVFAMGGVAFEDAPKDREQALRHIVRYVVVSFHCSITSPGSPKETQTVRCWPLFHTFALQHGIGSHNENAFD